MNIPHDASRSHGQPASARFSARPRTHRTVALVDARFIDWLGAPEGEAPAPRRERLAGLLEAVLLQAGLPPDLARIYWYDSDAAAAPVNGQVLRPVAPDGVDGGASLALSMARDLLTLAGNAACDHVLVATDDDRLLVAVDAAQQQGLRVHLLADESAGDLGALAATDAAWATLLRQADTRVVVAGTEVERALWGDGEVVLADRAPVARQPRWANAAAGQAERGGLRHPREGRGGYDEREGMPRQDARYDRDARGPREGRRPGPSPEELQAMRSALGPMLSDWWEGLPVEDREEFLEQLPAQRGLPQEVDRHLLLRLSQQLGRPLAPLEKKLMRDIAREVAGVDSTPEPAGVAPIPEGATS